MDNIYIIERELVLSRHRATQKRAASAARFFGGMIATMYIIAIGWLYVVLMMALTESSVVAGLLTLCLYGLAPLALFLWLFGTPERRRRKRRLGDEVIDHKVGEADGANAQRDE